MSKHKRFDKLAPEQQDHLFLALHDARDAANDRWLMALGEPIPMSAERALVEQYAEQLKDEPSAKRSMRGIREALSELV